MAEHPPVKYARNGDVHLAYRILGEGPDVVMTAAATNTMDFMLANPTVHRVAQHARVAIYDKRGTGASDHDARFTFEERVDDLRAVMDAAGIDAAHLYGTSEGGPVSIFFAATHPDRVRSLTLPGTFASWMARPDYPCGFDMSFREYSAWVDRMVDSMFGDADALRLILEMWTPSLAGDPEFLSRVGVLSSQSSPGAARTIWDALYEIDVRHLLSSVRVPTTVVHFTGDRVCPIEGGRYLAEHIPDARFVELPGIDHLPPEPPMEIATAVLDHINHSESHVPGSSDRRLATVLFTDIVGSTASAGLLGDTAWVRALGEHDRVAASVIDDYQGNLVKSTGDGLLATFDGPSRALSCAEALHLRLGEIEQPIRAGLHAGEIEVRSNGDIAGMAVHVAARVSALAESGETMVTSTVKDLVVGSDHRFEDLGDRELRGVEDIWHCYKLVAVPN